MNCRCVNLDWSSLSISDSQKKTFFLGSLELPYIDARVKKSNACHAHCTDTGFEGLNFCQGKRSGTTPPISGPEPLC